MDEDKDVTFIENNPHIVRSAEKFNNYAMDHNMTYGELQVKETCHLLCVGIIGK